MVIDILEERVADLRHRAYLAAICCCDAVAHGNLRRARVEAIEARRLDSEMNEALHDSNVAWLAQRRAG